MRKEKPSKTARKVALNIVTLRAKHGMEEVLPPDIVDATAKLLVESGAVGQRAVRFSRSRMAVGIYLAFDWMMPGQFEAFAHRKAFCERQVRKGIEAGANQVLVLGAGYDTLGWRLAPEFASVNFFEIDHPATVRLKAKGIEAMGQPTNLHLIAEDLGERQLVDVLHADATWNSIAPTVIVAEGLLMYLPPEAVGALFEQCAEVTGAGSRIAFTYVGTRSNGRPDAGPWTWLVLWLLKVVGEPWLWSIPPEELCPFLNEHDWTTADDQTELSDKCGIEFHGIAVK
jgi:methyltransferase (TIGR00027 family)